MCNRHSNELTTKELTLAWLVIVAVVLLYVYVGACTYKLTESRFVHDEGNRGIAASLWPIYWVWRGIDAGSSWAENKPTNNVEQ